VYLESGYGLGTDGVWRLGRHAWEQIARGEKPSLRRNRELHRDLPHDAVDADGRRIMTPIGDVKPHPVPPSLPALVQCSRPGGNTRPVCGFVNEITAEVTGADQDRRLREGVPYSTIWFCRCCTTDYERTSAHQLWREARAKARRNAARPRR
jgi:hypothetical protein